MGQLSYWSQVRARALRLKSDRPQLRNWDYANWWALDPREPRMSEPLSGAVLELYFERLTNWAMGLARQ
jgi:hypothetical protein